MKNSTLAPLLSPLFIATLITSHLVAMDDSAIIPRPPAKEFAYHHCVPTLLSLAITKASYEDIEKHVPASYYIYNYALAFKDEPEHTNPIEFLNLDLANKTVNEWLWLYIYTGTRNKKCLEHVLAHTDFTQDTLAYGLQQSDVCENLQAIQLLVRQNARGEFFDRWQEFPLHNTIVRHAFLGENFMVSPTDDLSIIAHDKTPLNLAAAYNLPDVVKELVPFASPKDKNNSLYSAASYGAEAVILPLIASGAQVNARSPHGNSSLSTTIQNNYIKTAEFLIDNGADVNEKNLHGSTTLLHWTNSGDMTSLLIRRGVNVHAKDSKGYTPLHFAARENNVSKAWILLDGGALVDAETDENSTALHLAAARGHISMTRLLIARGANVQAKNCYNQTPRTSALMNIRDEELRYKIISLLTSAQ